ncbi:hypothetical protein N7U66_17735 [Lacinutrix neustonica]|uniref:Uncharacterized protein n=1 Tax=Lacinutrix neustonica TaxID=2980107 RepID=A0A9E8MUN9_9FLAO|nr:hypothetical protein [Lacinutrix neustonica]WAC01721.1 hypothetical protein N7U66_17735 [Lacinutrix neustonica]
MIKKQPTTQGAVYCNTLCTYKKNTILLIFTFLSLSIFNSGAQNVNTTSKGDTPLLIQNRGSRDRHVTTFIKPTVSNKRNLLKGETPRDYIRLFHS